mmetsp:Transcript_33511/g.92572  ORF Transcript_33511/g.92572 Transcript_33511/m.92572 type:complete len:360 (+) Transcript_33511:74-1153(+)
MGCPQSRSAGLCRGASQNTNENVCGDFNCEAIPEDSTVHVLICALDYKRTSTPLTCTMDGKNMQTLCASCRIDDVTVMLDEECTSEAVEEKLRDVASRCKEGDYFVFYYSGHGTNVEDLGGDEEDVFDEAFGFVDANGQISRETIMTDDEFADILTECVPIGTKILILTDCCHSGTIVDLTKPEWGSHTALSITGCTDKQTSGDVGTGGIFTHSMALATEKIEEQGEDEYSAGLLYNTILAYDNFVFQSAQDMTIQCTRNCTPDTFAWPLVPKFQYRSPMTDAVSKMSQVRSDRVMYAASGTASEKPFSNIMHLGMANPVLLQQLGVDPNVAKIAAGGVTEDVNIKSVMQTGAASRKCC